MMIVMNLRNCVVYVGAVDAEYEDGGPEGDGGEELTEDVEEEVDVVSKVVRIRTGTEG